MAKNKRPPVDIGDVTETLKESKGQGMDVFFPTPPHNTADDNKDLKPKKKTRAIKTPEDDNIFLDESKKLNEESLNTLDDVMTSLLQDVNLRGWKDTIENTETRGSSLRLTNDEIYSVQDILKDLERQLKIKTSINELARLGLLFLIHDFKKNGAKSLIYKVKKS